MFKNVLSKDLVKIYFSEYSTIGFAQIKQKTKKLDEEIKKYPDLAVPSWLEGRAKDISLNTFNFIKNNKYLLSPSKTSFAYHEYQQLSKFKPAIQNMDILNKEIYKINSIKRKQIEGKFFKYAVISIFSIALYFLKISLPKDSQLAITIGLIMFLLYCLFKKNTKKG